MTTPITVRDMAPLWQITGAGPEGLEASLETLSRQFDGSGAILFRLRNGDTSRDVQTLASHGIDPVLTDAVVERATNAITKGRQPETLPVTIPAWRIGGTPAFIYAFPACPMAHGQLVTACLSTRSKDFAGIAEMYLASRCIMDEAEMMRDRNGDTDHPKISTREQACLAWTAEGKTSEEIGIILELSPHTVNHYLGSAARKLGATNRMHAVAKALRLGLIERPV